MRTAAACALVFGSFALGGFQLTSWAQGAGPAPAAKAKPAPAEAAGSEALFAGPDNCHKCHREEGWSKFKEPPKGSFDHAATGFPLEHAHARQTCTKCHGNGLQRLSSRCVTCHRDPHAGANTLSCGECHTAKSWDVPRNTFTHDRTRFPLSGAHATLNCEACHRPSRGEALAITPTHCAACHVKDRIRATPNHLAAGFTECGWCHTTTSWKRAVYTHNSWALTGAHALAACTDCHTGTTFQGLASGGSDCLSCHQAEFTSTASNPSAPNHTVGAPFGSDCGRCHDNVNPPLTFQGATIR